MANTYLTVAFKDKDAAKALGARWDGVHRQWFVPEGRDLTPFVTWLPAGSSEVVIASSVELITFSGTGASLAVPKKGVTLSSLLAGVSQAVAQAYKAGVWTLVEVVAHDRLERQAQQGEPVTANVSSVKDMIAGRRSGLRSTCPARLEVIGLERGGPSPFTAAHVLPEKNNAHLQDAACVCQWARKSSLQPKPSA